MGRPSKKNTLDLKQVERLARIGWTDAQMAAFFEVSLRTWHDWKAADEELRWSLREWKAEADQRVERCLYERAVGYSHSDEKVFFPAGADKPIIVPTTKHYPPDTTALIFWLKNRQPQEWRDKREHEHTGKDGAKLLIGAEPMSEQAWIDEYGASSGDDETKH